MIQIRWFILAFFLPTLASAGLVRVEVKEQAPFAGGISFGRSGRYELVEGRLFFEADPVQPQGMTPVILG